MNSNTMETYCGHVRTPADAIKLFEACRLGLLPRVQRRLSEKERQSIKSGSVFVWDEREAGMRRWTDGKSWSASRVSGSFLTYREMEGKRGGGNFVSAPTRPRVAGKTPDSGRGSDEDAEMDGEGVDGYRYKPDGLMKQSFSITTSSGQHLHLISYYSRHHANSHELLQPTADPELRHLTAAKGMYPESTVQEQAQGPAVTRAPMQGAYASPHQMAPGPPPQAHRGPYPYPMQPGYSWPPSPMSTPPYNYAMGPYGQLQQPQPGSVHASPHQGGQMIPQYERQSSSIDPSLAPPSNHRMSMSNQQQLPMYPSGQSPRQIHARLLAEQQARQATKLAMEQQQMMHSPRIDPRIMNMAPQPMPSAANPSQPTPLIDSGSQNGGSMSSPSQSQNIPSISSMVHHHTPSSTNATTTPDLPTEEVKSASNPSNGTASRPGSSSPRDGKTKSNGDGGPQDIPHAKLGFGGEDLRALRVLDRKFCI